MAKRKQWRCFHCDEVLKTRVAAAEHFSSGDYENEPPLCIEAATTDLRKLVLTNREMWQQVRSLESQLEEAEDHIAGWEYTARKLTKKPDATAHDLECEWDSMQGRVVTAEAIIDGSYWRLEDKAATNG
jgi:hypothetical protein